jgi:hypothetical protein
MIELAGHILKTKAAHFDPSTFKDEYGVDSGPAPSERTSRSREAITALILRSPAKRSEGGRLEGWQLGRP